MQAAVVTHGAADAEVQGQSADHDNQNSNPRVHHERKREEGSRRKELTPKKKSACVCGEYAVEER